MIILLTTAYILLLLSPVIECLPLSVPINPTRQYPTRHGPLFIEPTKIKIDKRQQGLDYESATQAASQLASTPSLSKAIVSSDVAVSSIIMSIPTESSTVSSQGGPPPASYRPAQIPGRSPLRITYLNGDKVEENASNSSAPSRVRQTLTSPTTSLAATGSVLPDSPSNDDTPAKRESVSSYNKIVDSRKKEFHRLGLVALVTGSATLGIFLTALTLWLVFVRRPRWLAQYIYLGQKTHEPQNKIKRSLSLRRFQGNSRPPMSDAHKYSGDEICALESEYTRSR